MKTLRIVVFLGVVAFLQNAAAKPNDVVVSRMKRQPVASSNVASVGYSRRLHALEIEFTRGAIYRFLDVPKSVYRDLMGSSSKGRFIAENLRDRYRFVRVRPGKPMPREPLAERNRPPSS